MDDALSKLDPGTSLAIGPLNTAGQAFHWAEACRRDLSIKAFSFADTRRKMRTLDGPTHRRAMHHRVRPSILKRLWVNHLVSGTTHFLAESFMSVTGDRRVDDLRHDLPWLERRDIHVGVLFHGSDIRSPQRHMETEPNSYYRLMSKEDVARFELEAAERRRRAVASGKPLFVSTPDLLQDLPEATWLPVVTDPAMWVVPHAPFHRPRLRVLHVPSRRHPPIKGTSFIDPILHRLHLEGLIEYVSPEGVPHEEMIGLVASVDIVIDQILSGAYGVAAIEAMSAGRLVIGSLGSDVRRVVGDEIPIVDTTPTGIEALMREIVDNREKFADIARIGPTYVETHHAGSKSARVLSRWILDTD